MNEDPFLENISNELRQLMGQKSAIELTEEVLGKYECMSEGHNGRIQINDEKWIDAQIELDIYPQQVIIEEPKFSHEWSHLRQWSNSGKIEGTLTSHGVELFRGMFQEWGRTEPWMFLMSQEMYWTLEYAKQGKRYPSPRKRKSKARMSKKWRTYGAK